MKLLKLGGRLTTLASVVAITLFSGSATTASTIDASPYSTTVASVSPGAMVAKKIVSNDEIARYTVVLNDPPLVGYDGGNVSLKGAIRQFAVAPRTARGRIDVKSAQALSYVSFLQEKQADFVHDLSSQLGRSLGAAATMQHAINAVVLDLSRIEVEQLQRRDDVLLVDKEHAEQLLTDRSAAFIGANTVWNGTSTGGVMSQGEGMVIAELDTGIAWDSPSFAPTANTTTGDNYTVVNPLGAGTYLGLCNPAATAHADSAHCNSKLIGMYNFLSTSTTRSGADDEGHGSHTASTAAGNHRSATYINANFNISGMAPHANVVAYKVCAAGAGATCTSTASTQAANQTVADGIVDAINYSIGGGTDPWNDATSLAFLGAVNAGIFVAAAAGNDGPTVSTTGHIEPWVATVAATTEDRVIGFPFNLTAPGPVPTNTQNIALRPGAAPLPTADLTNVAIIQSPTFADGDNDACTPYADPNTFRVGDTAAGAQAIAVVHLAQSSTTRCAAGSGGRRTNALNAGAIGVIFVDPAYINLGASGTSWSMLMSDWNNVYAQILTNPAIATASISATGAAFPGVGDQLADFSSRGPNVGVGGQLIVKPEIAAPGVDILAAYASSTGATATSPNLPLDPTRVLLDNGTSMSTPHIAGSGLLLRSLHPSWSPLQIRSALMLNAKLTGLVRADGVTPTDIFDRGAGRVDVAAAAKTGLIMDETFANFTAANPAKGGKIATLNLPSMAEGNCVISCSFARTVQSARAAGTPQVTWTLAVSGLPSTSAVVSPTSFKINGSPANASFTVTVDATKLPDGISQGLLTLTPSDPTISTAHMPIAVKKGPPTITATPATLSSTLLPNQTSNATVTVKNVGNPTLNWASTNGGGITLLNTSAGTSGFPAGVYSKVAPPNGLWQGQNFNVPAASVVTKVAANGFSQGANPTATNTTGITFSIYADGTYNGNSGVPAGVPDGTGAAPLWTVTRTVGSAGVGITGGFSLDLTAAGLTPPALPAGRYWLVVYPTLNSNYLATGTASASNPAWNWLMSPDAQIGNPAVIIQPPFDTVWDTLVNNGGQPALSALVSGTVNCTAPAWVSYTNMSGALAANASGSGTVTFNSTGLSPGTYTSVLCLASNDPVTPNVVIPLTLTVSNPPTNPQITGSATPSPVNPGAVTLLTATVTPGAFPTSSNVQVRVDLSSVGGSNSQPMFDDGSNGDVTAGDGIYSYSETVPANTTAGDRNLPVTLNDAQSRAASTSILLSISAQTGLLTTASATPDSVLPGANTHLSVNVTPGTNPASTAIQVSADLTAIGGSAAQAFVDGGSGTFGYDATVGSTVTPGLKTIPVTTTDAQGRSSSTTIALDIPAASLPAAVGLANPSPVIPGNSVLLIVSTSPGSNPVSTGMSVSVDLSGIGGSASQAFYDDGTHGDQTAGDGVFSYQSPTDPGLPLDATLSLPATVTDAQSRTATLAIPLMTGNDRVFGDGFDGP